MVVEVYNEEKFLPFCLVPMLPCIDECIIVDGSENGPSTDNTAAIVSDFKAKYPEKITYIRGTYRRDDGAWDDTAQNNEAFKHVTGKFVMRTHADIIYDYQDMEFIRKTVERFPDKKIFYCPMVEFFYDTKHIRLYPDSKYEELFARPIVGDVPVISMELKPHFEDIGEYRRSGLQADGFTHRDTIYMPHVRRFHYGWVKPFKEQVLKHVKYINRGDHGEHGAKLKAKGEGAVFVWARQHVLSYETDPSKFPYAGEYPETAEPLRDMTSMDGYKEFMEEYNDC